jgi:hypothetical protein
VLIRNKIDFFLWLPVSQQIRCKSYLDEKFSHISVLTLKYDQIFHAFLLGKYLSLFQLLEMYKNDELEYELSPKTEFFA